MESFDKMCLMYWEGIQFKGDKERLNDLLKEIVTFIMKATFGKYNGVYLCLVMEYLKDSARNTPHKTGIIKVIERVKNDFLLNTENRFCQRWPEFSSSLSVPSSQ